jgi:hypothetical protein
MPIGRFALPDAVRTAYSPFIRRERMVVIGWQVQQAGPWWTVDLCFCPHPFRFTKQSAAFVRDNLATD